MTESMHRAVSHVIVWSLVCALSLVVALAAVSQETERVKTIDPPRSGLPGEEQSRDVKRFSFFVYGDTRGRHDGVAIQPDHSLIVDSMLNEIKKRATTDYPVRFVLQSGDAVLDGRDPRQWNVSFVPVINRLTTEGNVPYFLVPGNHEGTGTDVGLHNYLNAVSSLIPPDGSQRRLLGSTTYAFGYGNTFIIALDANKADDQKQYEWIKSQLEGLDRKRYVNVIVFCHQAVFSSGPHGGPTLEPETVALRARYMPLLNAHHVRAVFSGHEHLFEHWVERYVDSTGPHRMDFVVSGGGGAPIYPYTGEPNISDFLKANEANKVTLEHLVKPGIDRGSNPYHYVIVRVDGDQIDMEVVGIDWGRDFSPYRSNKIELRDLTR